MIRRHIFKDNILLLVAIGCVLMALSLSSCAVGEPAEPEAISGPGSEYVQQVEMDSNITQNYIGLRCVEGYQTFDIDDVRRDTYKFLDMNIRIGSEGEVMGDDPDTYENEGFYAQDWASIKFNLSDDLELPVIIIHAITTSYRDVDDQLVVPEIGPGGRVSMRFDTDNYIGGLAGQIHGLTLCLRVDG